MRPSFVLDAPFPWFGGKSRAAHLIWPRFGDVPNYVEPFAGSLAVLLARPHEPRAETVNDLDAYLANFWRAIHADPEQVAAFADWPVSEADLHARHSWLVGQSEFRERMLTDPFYFDARIAGWWAWGLCQWIGGGWCRRPGWKRVRTGYGVGLTAASVWKQRPALHALNGVHADRAWRKRPVLGRGERGVQRKLVYLARGGQGVHRKRPMLKPGLPGVLRSGVYGTDGTDGIYARTDRQLPNLGGAGSGSGRGLLRWTRNDGLAEWFASLASRLRRVRVCCGDWSRVLGKSPTTHIGMTAILLDPPYGERAGRYHRGNSQGLYSTDDLSVADAVREWAIANGENPKMRIALCGYEGEHAMPADWECVEWRAQGGYGNRRGNLNRYKERIWFSPHCLKIQEQE